MNTLSPKAEFTNTYQWVFYVKYHYLQFNQIIMEAEG